MRALTAIVTLTFLSVATPGAVTTVAAAERACGTEAAAYLAAADPATARDDLLFCLLGDVAVRTDIVKFGEEGAFYYKAYPSTRRVTSGRDAVAVSSDDLGGGSFSKLVFDDCTTKKTRKLRLVDDGGSMKLEQEDMFVFSASTVADFLADREQAGNRLASTLQLPLALDFAPNVPADNANPLVAYMWANAASKATDTSGDCPPSNFGLVSTGGQAWNIRNPSYLQNLQGFGEIEIMEFTR